LFDVMCETKLASVISFERTLNWRREYHVISYYL